MRHEARGFIPLEARSSGAADTKRVLPLTGFTLIELMVVLAIIVVITAIAITSQSAFNKSIILANTAYDVALTLRSAESYGLGSRAAGTVANAGYGVHFERGTPNTITLFADLYPGPGPSSANNCHPVSDPNVPSALPGNCRYDASQGERVTSFLLGNGITVSDFCVHNNGWSCATTGNQSLSSLDIVFSRPNPDPFISWNGQVYFVTSPPTDAACMTLTSPSGGFRYVSVAASGEITANDTSCP